MAATNARRKARPPKPDAKSPGRRAQKKEATKARIVDAALQLFHTRGFDATTTKEIARKAGIAEGTVFNYFETKEDIALHFFDQEVDHAIAAVRANRRLRKAPLDEKLFALVQSQFEYLAPHEGFISVALIQALKPASKLGPFSPQMAACRQRYIAFVQELIDEALPKQNLTAIGWWAPQAFWIYYLGALFYWLHDTSPTKQNTLAFLDRSLKVGVSVLKGGRL